MDTGFILVGGLRGVDWKVREASWRISNTWPEFTKDLTCLARGNAARAFDAGVCDNARRKLIIFHGERGPERLPFIIGWHLHAVFTLIEV